MYKKSKLIIVLALVYLLTALSVTEAQTLPSTQPAPFYKTSPSPITGAVVTGPVTFKWTQTSAPVVFCLSTTNGVCPNGSSGYSPTTGGSITLNLMPGTYYWQVRELWTGGFVPADGSGIWGKVTVQNKDPIGVVDGLAANGAINGWAYDPDNSSKSIAIHVYLDAPAGAGGIFQGAVLANLPRPDVNQAAGISGSHGFSWPLPTTLSLHHRSTLYFYAINDTLGKNPLLWPPVSVGRKTHWYDPIKKITCDFNITSGSFTCSL